MKEFGFSILEVMLAMAVFMIFSTSAIGVIIQGFSSNRLAIETTIANQYAGEGLEALRSIRNTTYAGLTNTNNTGILRTGGVWTLSGLNNTLDKYTRTLSIANVFRDASGNVVATGGTLDTNIKKVSASVTWNAGFAAPRSLLLSSYLSNWKAANSSQRGGVLVYGDGAKNNDAIRYRVLDGQTGLWGAVGSLVDIDPTTTNKALRAVRIFSSQTRNEKVVLIKGRSGAGQFMYAEVYNGSTWGNLKALSTWTDGTQVQARNFDAAYLANGDLMAIYSDFSTTPKAIIWNGSTWSAPFSLQPISGPPTYIVARARPGTNEVMVAIYDANLHTSTQYFNGGAYQSANWTANVEHSSGGTSSSRELIVFSWSPYNTLVGAISYPDSTSDKTITTKIWTANGLGAGSWSAVANSPVGPAGLGSLAIASPISKSEFVTCTKYKTDLDIWCFSSNFTPAWTTPANYIITNQTQNGLQRSFDMDFEGNSSTRGIIVYSDNTNIPKLKRYSPTLVLWDVSPISAPALGQKLMTVQLVRTPDNDDIMILLGDSNFDMYTIIWNGANNTLYTTPAGKALTVQGINGSDTDEFWYDYAWDQF